MMPRFQTPDPPRRDSEIVKHCDTIKITLYREPDGDLSGCFELEGSFGNFSDDGTQEGVSDGLRFIRELMREFSKRNEG